MNEQRSEKNYKSLAFLPMIIFLALYVGSGVVFTILGAENPFDKISRYVAILIAICVAFLFYARKTPLDKKINVYAKGAGSSGVMFLGLIILLAGAFSSAAEAMGGKESLVNLGLTLIPTDFLIPGIFIVTCIISTSIGTSMGTQVAMIPVAIAIAEGAGLNGAMAGAATIAGAYFGDNLSMISDTTIAATKGVGAEMKDKFKMNFFIALPDAVITIVLYWILGAGSNVKELGELNYNVLTVLPYITVLVTAIIGMNVVTVLIVGIVMSGIIGMAVGTFSFFDWTMAVSTGMQDMFWLFVFASLIAGLIELIRYYGGIEWLVNSLTAKIKGSKSAEYLISLLSMGISGATLNNPVAIIISAPLAKIMGEQYKISPKRLASLLDIFACVILMVLPHDSGMLLVQQYGDVNYLEILKYSFYPVLLTLFSVLTIQFNISRTNKEREQENLVSPLSDKMEA